MKIRSLICLMLFVSLLLIGCTTTTSSTETKFFYCNNEIAFSTTDRVIDSEQRNEKVDPLDYGAIISKYLEGPTSKKLSNPFPDNTKLVSFTIDQQVSYVVLSNNFSNLTGIDLTLACACLSLTVENITGCAQVQISTPDALLDNKPSITVNTNDISLLSSYE